MTDLRRQSLWLAFAAVTAALALVIVHALERFGGYVPCELCLTQRKVDWVALAIALVSLGFSRLRGSAAAVGVVAVGVAFLVGSGVAAYHAGVEWKWWPGPQTCTGRGVGPVSAADVRAVLSGATRVRMVRCDEAALRVLGVSLSGWNALLSLALSLGSFAVVIPPRRRL